MTARAKILAAGFTLALMFGLAPPAALGESCPPLDPTCATDALDGVPELPDVPPMEDVPDPVEDAVDDVEDAVDDVKDAVDDIVDPGPGEEPDPDEDPVEDDDPSGDDDRSGGGGAGGGRFGGSGPNLADGRLGEVSLGSSAPGSSAIASRDAPSANGGVGRAAANAAKQAAFPLALLLIVMAYSVIQDRVDRRDPKLALAPVRSDDLSFA